jgi:hypothetical protein
MTGKCWDNRNHERKEKIAKMDDFHARRMVSVTQCTDERLGEVFAEQSRVPLAGSPLQNGKSDQEKHRGIDRNEERRADPREQNAGESGADNACKVHLHPSQGDRGGQLLVIDDIRNYRSHNRSSKGKPSAQRENANQHRNRVDYSCPSSNREET